MALPHDCGKYELLDGELVYMPPTGDDHSVSSVRFIVGLASFVYGHGLGEVFEGQVGFRLTPEILRGNVLSPDVSFVSKARLTGMKQGRNKFLLGAPDFAVEVRSPSETWAFLSRKKDEYFAHGCRLLWIANLRTAEVHVWTPAGKQAVLGEDATLDGADVLPGFTLSVRQIFE